MSAKSPGSISPDLENAGPEANEMITLSEKEEAESRREIKSRKGRLVPFSESVLPPHLAELRYAYPEFLPDRYFKLKRHKLGEKMERFDMISRRKVIDIPEFYVGSVLAVTVSDPYAPGKVSRFVGICIRRTGQGLRHTFTLRNVIDHQGVEIRYDLYNPTIREIEVLRLEKRLDDCLLYLRDALPEYSTFPFDMTPEPHTEGEPVPINPIRVQLKPWPWTRRWEVFQFRGVGKLENIPDYFSRYRNKQNRPDYNEKYDTMLEYRKHVPEDEQLAIWEDVYEHKKEMETLRKSDKRKKYLLQQKA